MGRWWWLPVVLAFLAGSVFGYVVAIGEPRDAPAPQSTPATIAPRPGVSDSPHWIAGLDLIEDLGDCAVLRGFRALDRSVNGERQPGSWQSLMAWSWSASAEARMRTLRCPEVP